MQAIRAISAFFSLALVLAISAGCSKSDLVAKATGQWSGSPSIPANLKDNPAVKAMAGSLKYSFDLKADQSFTGDMGMTPIEGNWDIEGGKVCLTMTKMAGQDVSEAKKKIEDMQKSVPNLPKMPDDFDKLYGTLSADGATMDLEEPGMGGQKTTIKLTKGPS